MSEWRVYGGNETNRWKDRIGDSGSCQVYVKARSKAHAVRILSEFVGQMTLKNFNDYWCPSGNSLALALCDYDGAQVWVGRDDAWVRIYDARSQKEIL